jgi:hypothetical protein
MARYRGRSHDGPAIRIAFHLQAASFVDGGVTVQPGESVKSSPAFPGPLNALFHTRDLLRNAVTRSANNDPESMCQLPRVD